MYHTQLTLDQAVEELNAERGCLNIFESFRMFLKLFESFADPRTSMRQRYDIMDTTLERESETKLHASALSLRVV